jgi:uncharacterized integral membrane protein
MTSPPVNEQTTGPGTAPQNPAAGQLPPQHVVKRTRVGGIWVASALFAVVLLLLLIFILENGQRVDIGYFGAHGHLPLGVALLLAAVLGVLLVVIPGTGRIIQLRLAARRHRRLDARRGDAARPAAPQPAAAGQQAQPDQLAQGTGPAAAGDPALPGPPVPPGQPAIKRTATKVQP